MRWLARAIEIPWLGRSLSLGGELTGIGGSGRDGIVVVGLRAVGEVRAVDLRDRSCEGEPGVAQAKEHVEAAIFERTGPQGSQPRNLGVGRGVRAGEEGLQVELAQALPLPPALSRPERHSPRAPELVAPARAPLADPTPRCRDRRR